MYKINWGNFFISTSIKLIFSYGNIVPVDQHTKLVFFFFFTIFDFPTTRMK